MSTFALGALARRRTGVVRLASWPELSSALLLALVGIELAVLVALLPDTATIWWQGKPSPDFQLLLNAARDLKPNGLYSPGLSLLLYPLTLLDQANAYRVYTALGALAVVAVAYLAQRGIRPIEARVAVALGVISIPQMHWALRFGHLTPFLALAALGGFLLLRRRPYLAGLCFAFLILKPQYAPIPALYLLWTRNRRALAGLLGGAVVLEMAGFAAAGFGEIGPYVRGLLDMGADSRDNLLAVQQAWQYAWPGFLISAGLEANPLLVIDALALSLAAVMLVWLRGNAPTAVAAAALGMLLVTPYANFYDWGLLVVAGALLLRADIRWKSLLPVIAVGLYVALIATQAATPWPINGMEINVVQTGDQLSLAVGDIGTRGLYWVTPAALAAVCFLAVAAHRGGRSDATDHATGTPQTRRGLHDLQRLHGSPTASQRLAPGCSLDAGRAVPGARLSRRRSRGQRPAPQTPLRPLLAHQPSSIQLPPGFPVPADAHVESAGRGAKLPYHVQWTSAEPVPAVSAIYEDLLKSGNWELMLREETSPSYRIRLSRLGPDGFMTHWAMLDVSPQEGGSRISLDFMITQGLTVTLN